MIGIWSLTLLFGFMFSLPLKVSIDELLHPHRPPGLEDWLSPFLFAGIELAILAAAIYVTLLHRKYGAARLELSAAPAAIGGCLAGTIITGKPINSLPKSTSNSPAPKSKAIAAPEASSISIRNNS